MEIFPPDQVGERLFVWKPDKAHALGEEHLFVEAHGKHDRDPERCVGQVSLAVQGQQDVRAATFNQVARAELHTADHGRVWLGGSIFPRAGFRCAPVARNRRRRIGLVVGPRGLF